MTAPLVGIDLGTTHSLVAIAEQGAPRVLLDAEGRKLLPSVVAIPEAGPPLVGEPALGFATRAARRTAYSIKRLIGRGLADVAAVRSLLPFDLSPSEPHRIALKLGERTMTPVALSAEILKQLKATAETALGTAVSRAVITVPAYFDDAQRQATIAAARLAGLEVARLVHEPTAACLAYGLDQRKNGLVAVYDLGGGTFDFSLLRLADGIFQVLATSGDTALGGDDLDRALMAVVAEQVKAAFGEDLLATPESTMALRGLVKTFKERLSGVERLALPIALPDGRALEIALDRADLERLAAPILAPTLKACRQALDDAGLTPDRLDAVVLVGGATRMPLVKRLVAEFFGQAPFDRLDPDEVVALGAAVQAEILAGARRDLLLLDVVPLSLGIETIGGGVSRLIDRNAPIPTSASAAFTTFVDNQTAVEIHVLQGERELARDNRSLAQFAIPIAPQPAGLPRIAVEFLLDADGVLTVRAADQRSGEAREVLVRPTYGLSEAEVARMQAEAEAHSEADQQARERLEATRKAEEMLRATDKALASEAARSFDEDLRDEIGRVRGMLETAIASGDPVFIRHCLGKLDEVTRDLAEWVLSANVKQALSR